MDFVNIGVVATDTLLGIPARDRVVGMVVWGIPTIAVWIVVWSIWAVTVLRPSRALENGGLEFFFGFRREH